jgi:hypothetical protein
MATILLLSLLTRPLFPPGAEIRPQDVGVFEILLFKRCGKSQFNVSGKVCIFSMTAGLFWIVRAPICDWFTVQGTLASIRNILTYRLKVSC